MSSYVLEGSYAVYKDSVLHFVEVLLGLLLILALYFEVFYDETVDWVLQAVE